MVLLDNGAMTHRKALIASGVVMVVFALVGCSAAPSARLAAPAEDGAQMSVGPTVIDASVEVQSVSNPESWVPTSTVFEGSPARIVVELDAPSAEDIDVEVKLPGLDQSIGQSSAAIPQGTSSVTVQLDTQHGAWIPDGSSSSQPNPADRLDIAVAVNGQDVTSAEPFAVPFRVAPRPVAFLHGMWASADWWNNYTKQGNFLATAHPDWRGFAVDTMDTGSALRPLARVNSVERNAELAWEYISARMAELNAHQFDVVGHSMGGVIIRRMLHDPAYGDQAQDAIRSVVLLGTPNGGSPCSDTIVVPANRELTFAAMEAFNETYPGYPGTFSTSLYADHYQLTCFDSSPGDFSVPAWSTQAQPVDVVEKIAPGVIHLEMTRNERIFSDYLKPALARPDGS